MRFEDKIKPNLPPKTAYVCESAPSMSSNGMDVRLSVTLDDKMHWGGRRSTAGLDRAHVLAFIRHVHIFDLDGELVLVQSHQTHSGIHRPLVLPGVEYAGPVQPGCVRSHVTLRTSKSRETELVYWSAA